ncbi:hypothetical protein F442_02307, partial [Phytophthora nicotianae P10297]
VETQKTHRCTCLERGLSCWLSQLRATPKSSKASQFLRTGTRIAQSRRQSSKRLSEQDNIVPAALNRAIKMSD